MEQIRNIIHRHGLVVTEVSIAKSLSAESDSFSLELFVPNGSALVVSEEVTSDVIDSTSGRRSRQAFPRRVVSGNNVALCDLEAFRAKLDFPDDKMVELTYSAVVVTAETVVHIHYRVKIDAVIFFTIAETELKVTPVPAVQGDE